MAPQSSAWTGEKPRKAGNGAGRGSAARSGEKVVPISPAGSAQEVRAYGSQARAIYLTTLARRDKSFARVVVLIFRNSQAVLCTGERKLSFLLAENL